MSLQTHGCDCMRLQTHVMRLYTNIATRKLYIVCIESHDMSLRVAMSREGYGTDRISHTGWYWCLVVYCK